MMRTAHCAQLLVCSITLAMPLAEPMLAVADGWPRQSVSQSASQWPLTGNTILKERMRKNQSID